MTTFLAGGTGTPKLLRGAESVFDPAETTVIANTGDDVALGGAFVSPDVDTMLFLDGDCLDQERWWGIADDSTETHDALGALRSEAGLGDAPRYLPDDQQTDGPAIANWRRFSGVSEFMEIGDQDRAIHLLRAGLLREGETLTAVTQTLADALGVERTILPMSDDPVATILHTPEGHQHFQEFWVANGGTPTVTAVEYRGAGKAEPTAAVRSALEEPVVIGPSNPITSIGPMVAMESFERALERTTVVAVSPFVGERLFSGPADKLMRATGYEASTAGVGEAYSFADAFVLDEEDPTEFDRPTVHTDTTLDSPDDTKRVCQALKTAIDRVESEMHTPAGEQ
ncbi:2-phospho-L-lactate transferase [Halocatena halophila]|uniref:2-phospho-L-lactate transferase n=1 Tax=Halocatena halophila TaxID=2814576 RepID=UPI002ED128C2